MPRSLEEVGGGSAGSMVEGGAAEAAAGGGHDAAQLVYVKKYYLIVAASVFFFNATIKYVTSRPKGKMRGGNKEHRAHSSIKIAQYIIFSRGENTRRANNSNNVLSIMFFRVDKYDRAIYLSRFLMAFLILCLLIVERQFLGPFSLLGLEVGFCLLQGNFLFIFL
jgi:hypothetical protein